ncbi:hypothetical protein ACFVWN_27525 [Nocardiopsis flavescens]|uniref:hypothetical protein n=1 Tax=Nocardiopsis flavescens TaxID=758803 RepID=UPI0036DF9A55
MRRAAPGRRAAARRAGPVVEGMYAGLGEATYGEWVRAENAPATVDPDALHPGARRYQQEQGLL